LYRYFKLPAIALPPQRCRLAVRWLPPAKSGDSTNVRRVLTSQAGRAAIAEGLRARAPRQ
jgi:hypothetical protein